MASASEGTEGKNNTTTVGTNFSAPENKVYVPHSPGKNAKNDLHKHLKQRLICTKSRTAKREIPGIDIINRKSESNCNEVESRKIDSESRIRTATYQCLKLLR